MVRDCPQKVNKGGNRNSNAPSGIPGDRVQETENNSIRQPLNYVRLSLTASGKPVL